MEVTAIAKDAVAGVPLVVVVIGLVEWIKTFGVSGRPLQLVSMAVGLVIGFAYQLSLNPGPYDYPFFFYVAIYGLILGLVASGIFDAASAIAKKSGEISLPDSNISENSRKFVEKKEGRK